MFADSPFGLVPKAGGILTVHSSVGYQVSIKQVQGELCAPAARHLSRQSRPDNLSVPDKN